MHWLDTSALLIVAGPTALKNRMLIDARASAKYELRIGAAIRISVEN